MQDQVAVPNSNAIALIVVFGVFLPGLTLALETCFGLMSSMFFDPLPTFVHYLLVATVPLANLGMVHALSGGKATLTKCWAWLHAFAMGIALVYAIRFLPFTPFAPFAVLLFGIGLLFLAPLLAFVAAVRGRMLMTRRSGTPLPYLWRGMGLALLVMMLLEAPSALTRIGMDMATSRSEQTRVNGVRWLRAVGSEQLMLSFCYGDSTLSTGLLGGLLDLRSTFNQAEARSIYFKTTGTVFNTMPAPPARKRRDFDLPFFDSDRGGERVGQRASGVQLASSRMDGSVDANAALGYLEWTMVFRNAATFQQEGRAEIQLPPGAVVSRATLWINGEEREAAFGSRGAVRKAYESVVKQQRDPLLVTTAGPGRVLVQLFPIPAGGEMKIRIGITAPMTMSSPEHAALQLPMFSERNFELAEGLRHAVWIESKTALEGGPALPSEQVSAQLFAVRGDVPEPAPRAAATVIIAPRKHPLDTMWSKDDKRKDDHIIVQSIREQALPAPRRVAVVIDNSSSLRALRTRLADVIAAVPGTPELAIVVADDAEPQLFVHNIRNSQATRVFLNNIVFEGGRDNSAALLKAWQWLSSTPNGRMIWVHGPQPEAGLELDNMVGDLRRQPSTIRLLDLEAARGPNHIATKLDGALGIDTVARNGAAHDDLKRVLDQWQPGARQAVVTRERVPARAMSNDSLTSPHLTRLWAAAQVDALAQTSAMREQAVALATTYQLVTPVSGAVVLETKEQYDAAGLEPVKPGTVPTIPEPETWAMIFIALGMLWMQRHRLRRA